VQLLWRRPGAVLHWEPERLEDRALSESEKVDNSCIGNSDRFPFDLMDLYPKVRMVQSYLRYSTILLIEMTPLSNRLIP